MRRAAYAVAAVALRMLPRPVPGRRVVLLVGPGNNGGDALYAGAVLRRRGADVLAVLADPERAHAGGLAAFQRRGGKLIDATDAMTAAVSALTRADLIIDGLLGLGARPPLRPTMARLVLAANAAPAPVLAIDLPSGIDPDGHRAAEPASEGNGATPGAEPQSGPESEPVAVDAASTITFGAPSTGLLLAPQTGRLEIADLGLAPDQRVLPDAIALDDIDVAFHRPRLGRDSDKYSSGVVGIVAGSAKYPGAALLCVGAAVSLRPGLVRYAGPQAAAVVQRWPEVVASDDPVDAGRVQAWVAGPGMGTDGPALRRLNVVLGADVPVLIDADGLTMLAHNPALLVRRERRSHAPVVLTPHAGEFARLWPELDLGDRLTACRAAARQSDAVVLLKGDRTVIAAPDGRAAVNLTGTPWLASAGTGDVLAGVIGSLLAAGNTPGGTLDAFTAAVVGAHIHGRAGQRAAAAGKVGAPALWEYLSAAG
nr:NAD(P)H-hydrate dehydratase [Nakamurella aerolata]